MKDITIEIYSNLSKQIRKNETRLKETRDTYKPAIYPSRRTMPHNESTVLVGNPIVSTVDSNQLDNSLYYQSVDNDGDTFTQSIVLAAGSYLFNVLGKEDNDCGIIDWTLDELVIVLGQDWYGAAYNVVKTTALTVLVDRNYVLKGTVNGRNPISNGHAMKLTKMWFKQVSD